MINKLTFMPSFSLEPNKCSSFVRVFRKNNRTVEAPDYQLKPKKRFLHNVVHDHPSCIIRKAHNFNLSANAHRTLKRRINWLYYLAKSKHVKTYSGKEIYNFKICFLTLTLPSKQETCTADLTKNYLNQFLTEIRQRTGMQNYVWRLEFQKNGNAHYHIVTDTYLDYWFALRIWNRVLAKGGYINKFSSKFSSMSLSDYNDATNKLRTTDFSVIAKRYAKGCKEKWRQPPTIDVKSVISNKAIANYISKYFSKSETNSSVCNELDNVDNSANLRLWFSSRSLSKLKSITNFCEAVDFNIFDIVSSAKDSKKFICRYATMYYFEISKLGKTCRVFVEKLLKTYALSVLYEPASCTVVNLKLKPI